MGRIARTRPSPAFVLAVIALSVALGGVSVAAVGLTTNEVKGRHIAAGAVSSSEVANGSLKSRDLSNGVLGGVQTGVVDAAGTSTSNPAVAVTRKGTGNYVLTFKPGTWTGQGRPLTMTVTPFGVNGAIVNPVVTGAQRGSDGSATFEVVLSSTQPALTPHDNPFMFTAATSG